MIKEYGYEFEATLDKELWAITKGKTTQGSLMGAMCLRSGRDALKAIAREYEPTIVLLPAMSCDSMALPFSLYAHKVRYYKLNCDYSIDFDHLYSLIPDQDNEILFLYMDYFGNKSITDEELEKLEEHFPKLVFIEDRTHNLLINKVSKFKPQYIIASLRKWINVPDGGLLWANKELKNNSFSDDLMFSATRLKAQCMRGEFFTTENQGIKTAYREIFSTVSDIIDKDNMPGRMSAYAYEIAKQADFEVIKNQRKINASILIDLLKENGFRFVQGIPGVSDLYVAILVENRDELQKKLSSLGIFCTIIWPLTKEQKQVSEVAKYTEEQMLAIYCDQRYNIEDMKYIASNLVRFCNE